MRTTAAAVELFTSQQRRRCDLVSSYLCSFCPATVSQELRVHGNAIRLSSCYCFSPAASLSLALAKGISLLWRIEPSAINCIRTVRSYQISSDQIGSARQSQVRGNNKVHVTTHE